MADDSEANRPATAQPADPAPTTMKSYAVTSDSMGSMIELAGLTKVFGRTRAVDDLTCSIEPGVVTGFLGPNGAGKSTTMRMILGLDHPTSGTATIDGRPYRELTDPLRHGRRAARRQADAPQPVGARAPALDRGHATGSRPAGSTRCSTWSA